MEKEKGEVEVKMKKKKVQVVLFRSHRVVFANLPKQKGPNGLMRNVPGVETCSAADRCMTSVGVRHRRIPRERAYWLRHVKKEPN